MINTPKAIERLKEKIKNSDIKLGYIDIETSPMLVYTFQIGQKISIYPEQIKEPGRVISVQYMFEGDKKPSYLHWNLKTHDDGPMLDETARILNSGDIWIAQNGDRFDFPTLQWRLNLLELTPLSEIITMDTLKLSRKSFRAPSHKLDYRSKCYGFGGKYKMELQDWIDVLNDKPGALNKMLRYGCKDITDLRELFWKELPYYKTLPASFAVLLNDDRDACPLCSSPKQTKHSLYATKVGKRQKYQCQDCGHIWKDSRIIK